MIIAKEFLALSLSQPNMIPYRRDSLKVINAVVDKGMDYPLKIEILGQIEYVKIMQAFQIKYRDRVMDRDEEE